MIENKIKMLMNKIELKYQNLNSMKNDMILNCIQKIQLKFYSKSGIWNCMKRKLFLKLY